MSEPNDTNHDLINDSPKLVVVDTTTEAIEKNVIGSTHVRRSFDERMKETSLRLKNAKHRKKKQFHRKDGILYSEARPKLWMISLGTLAHTVIIFFVLQQLGLSSFVSGLVSCGIAGMAITFWTVISIMTRYPHILEYILSCACLFTYEHQNYNQEDQTLDLENLVISLPNENQAEEEEEEELYAGGQESFQQRQRHNQSTTSLGYEADLEQ